MNKNEYMFSKRHNSMTKLCYALFKYEMKEKLVEIIDLQLCSSLKLDSM